MYYDTSMERASGFGSSTLHNGQSCALENWISAKAKIDLDLDLTLSKMHTYIFCKSIDKK